MAFPRRLCLWLSLWLWGVPEGPDEPDGPDEADGPDGPDESDGPDRPDVAVAVSVALIAFLLYRFGQLKRA